MNSTNRTSVLLVSMSLLIAGAAVAAEPKAGSASRDAMPAVTPTAPVLSDSDAPAAPTTKSAAPASATTQPARRTGNDRLKLDTTVVTGNRELPKVLYIVPWKRADIGDLMTQPMNTLLDEVLTPVDRDVFRREVTYYGTITRNADEINVAPATPPAASEK
ncbi:MAG: hypothetical protein ABW106_12865 [Steroidobacteraceae bacterium]